MIRARAMAIEAKLTLALAAPDDAVYALAASPDFARDGVCFAACASGLYRSADGGETWQRLPASSERVTTALALSPAFARDRSVFAAVKGGVLRSSNGGETWFTTAFPAPPPVFSALVVSPGYERDGMLLAATLEDGVFSSEDRGGRWGAWNFGLFDLNALCLALSPAWATDETAYVGTETGLYRSTNGGRAWRPSGFPAELAPAQCLLCLLDPDSGSQTLLVGTESHGLYASRDQGESWQRLAADAIEGVVNQLHLREGADGSPALYALTNDGVLRSDDCGLSWSRLFRVDGLPSAMLPLGDVILLGVQGEGIMRISLS